MGQALDTVTRFYDAFAGGDLDAADAVFADDCSFVMPPGVLTKAEHKQMAEVFRAAFPDSHMVVDHVLDAGDEVFVEGRFLGTHTGDFATPDGVLPASGSKIELRFADYFKVAGGRVCDHRTYWDQAQVMAQLGLTATG